MFISEILILEMKRLEMVISKCKSDSEFESKGLFILAPLKQQQLPEGAGDVTVMARKLSASTCPLTVRSASCHLTRPQSQLRSTEKDRPGDL